MKKLLPFLLLLAACSKHPEADQIVHGKIWTSNPKQPWAEAMAITDDSIVAIGSKNEVDVWKGDKTADISVPDGQLIVPGLIDTHTHFLEAGFGLSSVQLRDAMSKEEFIKRIKEFAAGMKPGMWMLGGNWDHQNWGGELPDRKWVDEFTKDIPIALMRTDGHMLFVNSAALKAAGISDNTKDVPGGEMVHDKSGRLTGVLKDNANELIWQKVPAASAESEDKALEAAMDYAAAHGVTSIHSMYGGNAAFDRAHASGKLRTRIYMGWMINDWRKVKRRVDSIGHGDKWLRWGALKMFMDGALGSHTAAFFKPFVDTPKDSGFFLNPEDWMYRQIKSADSAGLHLMIHAIGDKAIFTLLNMFEKAGRENGPRDRRFRIEHLQHIAPSDISRLAPLNVIASMQPYHAIDDGRWAEKYLGPERIKTTYAFKSLLDANAKVAFGSDWPVAPADPMMGIYAAVTRRTLDDKFPDGWVPEQKITVEQALTAYTITGAYASFEEGIKGSLEPGKLADFVVLERDITSIDPREIGQVKVVRTVVGGKTVFPH